MRATSTMGSAARWLSALVAAGVVGFSGSDDAAAQQLRFKTTTPGGIASTGNTLGLAKQRDANGPGTEHSIGTFITVDGAAADTDPLNPTNPWPTGTTWDWTQNSSTGNLQLPAGATVLYAELVWSGSYNYSPENVTSQIDTPITLIADGASVVVAPDDASAQTLAEQSYTGFLVNYYLRSADVTAFVEAHGATGYTVSGVPATQGTITNSLSAAGWSLVVAYRHDSQKIRNLTIFVGGSFVDEDAQQDYTVTGFCAPPHGEVEGKVIVSAVEGDANLTGEDLAIGESDSGTFVSLEGPNNPANNFFCSQINDGFGEVDTTGSFGNANHDALAGVNVSGARQGWDLTTVALSSALGHMANDQTSAVLRTTTVGDSYFPILAAFELDVTAPDFGDSMTEASTSVVQLGDELTVTTTLTNDGEAEADHLVLSLPLDPGLALNAFELDGQPGDAQGTPVDAAALAAGIDAGTLAPGELREVVLHLEVVAEPANGPEYVFAPVWEHSFHMCSADAPIDELFNGPTDSVAYDAGDPGTGGMGAGGEGGQGGSGGGLGTDPGDGYDDPVDEGACGCRVVGQQDATSWHWLALAGLGAAVVVRRRRKSPGN
jgi:MYXO-CTERM domain-containing protein/uncharacterized repeat protein (TIGR01451 family)